MALVGFAALTLCLFLVIESQAHAASPSRSLSFATRHVPDSSSPSSSSIGICASSVIIHGYKCHELHVTTKDGYILSLQRIPQGRAEVGGSGAQKKPPVIIQHGVLVAFWDWSWDELVTYDLPAVFDYVVSQTGQKINYVGHSLGTLIALASFSEGSLVDQLQAAVLLSPIAYLSHMNTALGVIAAKAFVGEITTLFGLAEFNPVGLPVAAFMRALCDYPGVDCYDLLTALTGKNCCLNASTVDLFLKNEPQSTSTKNMVHLAQTVRRGVLEKFNYVRPDYNVMHYGELMPPIYNLSNIPRDLPLFLSYGGQDALSDVLDVGSLLDCLKLHDVDKLSVQFVKNYGHADFIMGVNAKDIVYSSVLAFLRRQIPVR